MQITALVGTLGTSASQMSDKSYRSDIMPIVADAIITGASELPAALIIHHSPYTPSLSAINVLWKSRTGLDTQNLIEQLMVVTWTSAVPPFLCALLNLIIYVTMSSRNGWFLLYV
jgi:hypothetical protein